VERCQMFMRPVELCPGTIERFHYLDVK
jgi:hypothetical protein